MPATTHLLKLNYKANKASEDKTLMFYQLLANQLYLGRSTRQDIQTSVAFLCARVGYKFQVITTKANSQSLCSTGEVHVILSHTWNVRWLLYQAPKVYTDYKNASKISICDHWSTCIFHLLFTQWHIMGPCEYFWLWLHSYCLYLVLTLDFFCSIPVFLNISW